MKDIYKENGEYNRIFEIDFIRGVCILLVMFDHLMYNFAICYTEVAFLPTMNILGRTYWYSTLRTTVKPIVVATFFLISGISSSFSKNNFTRGFRIVAFALALTVVTTIAGNVSGNANLVIDFGVIHVFGFSILIYALIQNWKSVPLVIFGCVCTFLAWYIASLDIQTTSKLLLPIGVRPIGYQYGDYFSMFPWLGFFVIGGVVGRKIYGERKSLFKEFKPKFSKPLLAMGRNSIYYYFGEQIILIPTFYIIGMIWG